MDCPFKKNGCEYEDSHLATCFYNFEKYGQLVNLCQKLGYASCNFQLNNGNAMAAMDHFQSHHGALLAQSPAFEITLEHFKKALTLQSSPHFWTPIIAQLPEGQGHALLVPILNPNEDFSCLSVWLPDPDSPSGLQPSIQVQMELHETCQSVKNGFLPKQPKFCKTFFVQDTLTLAEAMEVSLESLFGKVRGIFLKDHMRNEEKMTILCKIKGNGSSLRETNLETFFCKLNCPFEYSGAGMTEKAMKWLEEEEAKAKVDRGSLWEFLVNLFDEPTKPDGYSYQEIAFVKERVFHLVLRQDTAAQLKFLKGKGLNMGNDYKNGRAGCTILQYVLLNDKEPQIALEKVKILVNPGMDFKRLDNCRVTVLHYASLFGNLQTVKYCLD